MDREQPGFRRRLVDQFRASRRHVMAAVALGMVAVALWGWRASGQVVAGAEGISWLTMLPDIAVAVLAGAAAAGLLALVAAAARRRLPWLLVATWIASAVLLATMGAAGAIRGWWLITVVILVAVPLLWPTRVGAVAAAVLSTHAGWLIWPGSEPDRAAQTVAEQVAAQQLPDPSARGPHGVEELRYATEPGAEVTTKAVDASSVITGWSPKLKQAWGFEPTALPLNATVWRPEGTGRFPLVLAVHGNATAGASQDGFQYLGEVLASRGYVVASIDENFLNTGVIGGMTHGLDQARSWLLLRHLDLWQAWSEAATGSTPLAGITDQTRASLIGHSRGGEAVAAAATAARGRVTTVVGIAPSDGLFTRGTELRGLTTSRSLVHMTPMC